MRIQLNIIVLLAIILQSCNLDKPNTEQTSSNTFEVKTISAMKKVMQGEDLSAHVFWDTIQKEHLFAVAPLGRIQGELTAIDGQMFTAVVDNSLNILLEQNWKIQSPFAVYAHVNEWLSFEIDEAIQSENHLQSIVEKIAIENQYDLNSAFPFRVLGDFLSIDFHIISKPLQEIEHNHNLHMKAKKHFHLENTSGELLGFFSKHHEGIFTHRGHYIHTHFIDAQRENMGHLENIQSDKKLELRLPKIN